MSGFEQAYVEHAFSSNWLAPLGPNVDAFEAEFLSALGHPEGAGALALSSGTAALHLALITAGVVAGDDVLVSTFTFCASVNPVLYCGANPVFIDSDARSWNMDPELLAHAIDRRAREGRPPRAVVVVHLYGQTADLEPIARACAEHGVTLIEDAAEALGATYAGRPAGTIGELAAFSFNGNKIITTSGGGMLVASGPRAQERIGRARKLSTQAREPAPHYEHVEIGYNYRMSNVLAGMGRGQLRVLPERVAARRRNFARYVALLGELPGVAFMPEPAWSRSSHWLTCLTIDPPAFGATREDVRLALDRADIEARPLWKPMHLQPAYRAHPVVGGAVAESLFECGLCLPSGSGLGDDDIARVAEHIRAVHDSAAARSRA